MGLHDTYPVFTRISRIMNNKPQGVIRLTGQQINNQLVSCTGPQLVKILQVLEEHTNNYDWFTADISTNNTPPSEFIDGEEPYRVGDTQRLIQLSLLVDQYFSGLFLAVPRGIEDPQWLGYFETESEPTTELGCAVLEIRAFDTSYFEIYCSELETLQALSRYFSLSKID